MALGGFRLVNVKYNKLYILQRQKEFEEMNNKRYAYNFLQNVEIEISSLCNRHCSYCPQCKIDRKRELLPFDIFEKIMYELKEINYSGGLAFHQYNEPLLEFEYLCKCISFSRKVNPNIRLELYTNGDLLTKKKYRKLKKLGVNRLVVTCHLNSDEKWSKKLAYTKVKAMLKKLNIHSNIEIKNSSVEKKESNLLNFIFKLKEFGYDAIKKYPFKLQIRSSDYNNNGSTRIDILDSVKASHIEDNSRTYYCYSLLHGIHVSYKGNVFMCCDCCEDTEMAKKYVIGSVYNEKIYDLFARKSSLVQDYMDENERLGICKNCYWNQ